MGRKRWRQYFADLQSRLALHKTEHEDIDYGEVIYTSPMVNNTRWLVTDYHGEYNVFTDKIDGSKTQRKWGASFAWKDRAIDFALKAVLVCSGKLKRKDRYG